MLLVVKTVCGRDVLLAHRTEARDALEHPTLHRTAPQMKNDLAQNVNSAEAEKPWSRFLHANKVTTLIRL